jgi:hypothetical protein
LISLIKIFGCAVTGGARGVKGIVKAKKKLCYWAPCVCQLLFAAVKVTESDKHSSCLLQ